MKLAIAAYRVLLRLYPRGFRERFGTGMEQAFRDRPSAAALLDVFVSAFLVRLSSREMRSMTLTSLFADVRYSLRLFARQPIFTTLAVAALGLGIGANTAIFTIVNGVLLRPLPYADASGLVMVWSTNAQTNRNRDAVAPLDFLDYRQAAAFTDLQASYSFLAGVPLTTPSGAEQMLVTAVTPGLFDMLGRMPAMGRVFTSAEAKTSIVLSHNFWQRRLGGDPAVVGRVLTIQNQPLTVVGVMPADFVFPYKTMLGPSGMARSYDVDGWLPLSFVTADSRATGDAPLTRSAHFLSVVGRLKAGVTARQADAEVRTIARHLATVYPASNRAVGAMVVPLHEQAVGALRPALVLLLGGAGFVLLMACVNLANLLLARSSARRREMAVRTALGATGARLVRQALVETLLLSLAGGAVALAVVRWGIGSLVALAPADMPRLGEVHADATVLAFALGLSLVTGLAIGVVPAVAVARRGAHTGLKDNGRGLTAGRGQRRLRAALVGAEMALALVLTHGSGLLLRSFLAVLAVDPGFAPDHLLTLQLALPSSYRTADQQRAVYADLFARLDALPGVVSSGGTTRLPLGSTTVSTKVDVEGRALPPGEWPEIEFRRALADYFTTMGIPLRRGRLFTADDGPAAPRVAIINDRMAQRLFPGEDPLGRRLRFGATSAPWVTIIGVVGDVRHSGLEEEPAPELYVWALQGPPVNPFIVVRTAGDAAALTAAVRAAVQAVDRTIAAYDIRPMAQVRAESMAERRFVLLLVAAFGALALVMAAIGVYGVMALVVAERTTEIGIRLALGAAPATVLAAVLREGLTLAGAGVAAGLAAAVAIVPAIATQLYGIRPFDALTLTLVPLLLLVVAAAACAVPACRATAVNPIDALRV